MQVPIRKGTGPIAPSQDPKMTIVKYEELKKKLDFWLKIKRPEEAAEVQRLALMGDFSENVGYQIAKGRLRSLNQRIIDLEKLLNQAEIIEKPISSEFINVGSKIKIKIKDSIKIITILGSAESDPSNGIISHVSPLGEALINKKAGDLIKVKQGDKENLYQVLEIL